MVLIIFNGSPERNWPLDSGGFVSPVCEALLAEVGQPASRGTRCQSLPSPLAQRWGQRGTSGAEGKTVPNPRNHICLGSCLFAQREIQYSLNPNCHANQKKKIKIKTHKCLKPSFSLVQCAKSRGHFPNTPCWKWRSVAAAWARCKRSHCRSWNAETFLYGSHRSKTSSSVSLGAALQRSNGSV